MPKLTTDEYKATMVPRPRRLGGGEMPPYNFWPYFDAIPPDDFGGHDFSAGKVSYVWNMPGTPYRHVLVQCETGNVVMVLVLNLDNRSVTGHHLLDLNDLYGLT